MPEVRRPRPKMGTAPARSVGMKYQEGKSMKYLRICAVTLAGALCCSVALAQHGHGGGMGQASAAGMGHGPSDHSMNTHEGGNSGSMHGMTVDQQLSRNTKLAGKIDHLTGMNAQQACSGFKNLGQCVAAAHVSKNLGISFACLKADMTGIAAPSGSSCPAGTGSKSMSLGKSIQTLRPTADSKSEAKRATRQADEDLKDSSNS